MAVCRFIDTVDGMSPVVGRGPSYFKALRCSGHGFVPACWIAGCHGETCNLVTLCWGSGACTCLILWAFASDSAVPGGRNLDQFRDHIENVCYSAAQHGAGPCG